MKRTAFFLFSCCLFFTLLGCQPQDSLDNIASYLEELDAEEKFSGVVLIAKDGEPILEKAYGEANRNYDVPNQLNTKFNLGSMNKMFTAVAMLQLVEQEKVSVDDKIIEHIPEYPNQEVAKIVTIHQLLTHTSGLGDFFNQEWSNTSKDHYKDLIDYLPLFVDHPLQFEPGTQFSYSNAGFIVLGIIIEQITGQTYFDFVRDNIYQPCGMNDTGFYEADRVVPNIAVGYAGFIRNYDDDASNFYKIPFIGSSAGGGYGTSGDMLKFSNCLVNHKLLNQELTKTLLEDKVYNPNPDIKGNYGYGFMVSAVNNHRVVGHSGGFPGACTNLDIFIDMGYTAVVLSNSSYDCVRVKVKIRETLSNQEYY